MEAQPTGYPYFVPPRAILHPSIQTVLGFTGREDELNAIHPTLMNEEERDEAVSALANVSLVSFSTFNDGASSISLHRLVQEVARGRMGENKRAAIFQGLDAMLTSWPSGNDGSNPSFWPICSRLLPHAMALREHTNTHEYNDDRTAGLLSFVGHHLDSRGAYSTVEPLYRRTLEIMKAILSPTHPHIEIIQANLEQLRTKLGK